MKVAVLAVSFALAFSAVVDAEPLTIDKDARPATLIEFRAEAEIGERIGRVEGVINEGSERLYLAGLDVMAPLVIQVFAKVPEKKIDVSLHRFMWEEDAWRGQTDENGDWAYVGRAHDEVGIMLKATEATAYYVLAWQGPAEKQRFGLAAVAAAPDSEALATSIDDTSESTGFLKILSYLVVALVAFGLAKLFARKRSSASLSVLAFTLLILLSGNAESQVVVDSGFEARLQASEARLQMLESAMLDAQKSDADIIDSVELLGEGVDEVWSEMLDMGIQFDQYKARVDRQLAELRDRDRSQIDVFADLKRLSRKTGRRSLILRMEITECPCRAGRDPTVKSIVSPVSWK